MTLPACLKDIWITKDLAETVAKFEFMNGGTLDDLAGDFVRELIAYSSKTLADPDAFYHDNYKAGVIYQNICEDGCSNSPLQTEWDSITDRLHEINVRDLINGVITAVVYTSEQKLKP